MQSAASEKQFRLACEKYAHPGMVEFAHFDGKVLKRATGKWHPFTSDLEAKHFAPMRPAMVYCQGCVCVGLPAAPTKGD